MGRACACCNDCETSTYHFNVDRYGFAATCFVKQEVVVYEQIYDIDASEAKLFSMKILEEAEVTYYKDEETICCNTWEAEQLSSKGLRGYQIANATSPDSPEWKKAEEEYPGIRFTALYSVKNIKVTTSTRKLVLKFNVHDVYDFLDKYKVGSSDSLSLDISPTGGDAPSQIERELWRFVQRAGLRLGGVIPNELRPSFVNVNQTLGKYSSDFKINGAAKDFNINSIDFDSFDDTADGYDLIYENDHNSFYSMDEYAVDVMDQLEDVGIDPGADNNIFFFIRPKEYVDVVDTYEERYKFTQENEDNSLYKERSRATGGEPRKEDGSKFIFGNWRDGPGPMWLELYRISKDSLSPYPFSPFLITDVYDSWLRDYTNKNSDWHDCFERVADKEYVSTCSYMNNSFDVTGFIPMDYFFRGAKLEVEFFKDKTSNKKSGARQSYFNQTYEMVYDRVDIKELEVSLYCYDNYRSKWRIDGIYSADDHLEIFKENNVILSSPPEIIEDFQIPPNGRSWIIEYYTKPRILSYWPSIERTTPYIWKFKYGDIIASEHLSAYRDSFGSFSPATNSIHNTAPFLESNVPGGFNRFVIRPCVFESTTGKRKDSSYYQDSDIEEIYNTVPHYGKYSPAKMRFKMLDAPYYPQTITITGGSEKCVGGCLSTGPTPEWRVLSQSFAGMGEPEDFKTAHHGTIPWAVIPKQIGLTPEPVYNGLVFLDGYSAQCITTLLSDRKTVSINKGLIEDRTYGLGVNTANYEPTETQGFSTNKIFTNTGAPNVMVTFGSNRGDGGISVVPWTGGSTEVTEEITKEPWINTCTTTVGTPVLAFKACDGEEFRSEYFGQNNVLQCFVGALVHQDDSTICGDFYHTYNTTRPPNIYEYLIFDFEVIDEYRTESVEFTKYQMEESGFSTNHSIQMIYEPFVKSIDFHAIYKRESNNRPGLRDLILGTHTPKNSLYDYPYPDSWPIYEFDVTEAKYITGAGIRFTIREDFFGGSLNIFEDKKSSKEDFVAVYQQWVPSISQDKQLTQDQIDEIAGYLTDFDYWYQIKGEIVAQDEDGDDIEVKDAYFYIASNGELNGPYESSGFIPTEPNIAVYDNVTMTFTGEVYKEEFQYTSAAKIINGQRETLLENMLTLDYNGGYYSAPTKNVEYGSQFGDSIFTDAFMPRLTRTTNSRLSATPKINADGCVDRSEFDFVQVEALIKTETNVGVWVERPEESYPEELQITIEGLPVLPEDDICFGSKSVYSASQGPINIYRENEPMFYSCLNDPKQRELYASAFTCVTSIVDIDGFPGGSVPRGETITQAVRSGYASIPQYEFDNQYYFTEDASSFISETSRSFFYPSDATFGVVYKKKIDAGDFSCGNLPAIDFTYDDLLYKEDNYFLASPPDKLFVYTVLDAEEVSTLDEEDLAIIKSEISSSVYDPTKYLRGFDGPAFRFSPDGPEPDDFQAYKYGVVDAVSWTGWPLSPKLYEYFAEKYSLDLKRAIEEFHETPIAAAISAEILRCSGGENGDKLTSFQRSVRIPYKGVDRNGQCPPSQTYPFEVPQCPIESRYLQTHDPITVEHEDCERIGHGRSRSGKTIKYKESFREVSFEDYSFTIGKKS